ncbi:transferase C1orf69 like protein [Trypanosoma vivax]|nr:transferase C1orf69 like protein [Trypanosoma vivax]
MGFKCRLLSRSLVRVSGTGSHEFLQGLFTNDLRSLQPGCSIWGCFLHYTGRVMCDAYLYQLTQPGTDDPVILVDVHQTVSTALVEHLKEMRLRRKVHIEDVGKELAVVATSSPEKPPLPGRGSLSLEGSETFEDPRSFAFPAPLYKTILPAAHTPSVSDPESTYDSFLHASGVGEGPDVFRPSKSLPFEANADFLRGVSFHKGCYMGQELTHRTHVMLVTRKRTIPFQIGRGQGDGECCPGKGEMLLVGDKTAGEVLTVCGSLGLGLLRLNYVDPATRTVPGLQLPNGTPVHASIPSWWDEKELRKALSTT